MFKWRLPISVYGDDANTVAFNQAAVAGLVDWAVAYPPIGQGYLLRALGGSARHQSTSSLAHLMLADKDQLGGIVEIDEFYFGGAPRRDASSPRPGRGRKGLPKTLKTPAIAVVQRPDALAKGTPAGKAGAMVVDDLSEVEADRVLSAKVDPAAHLMSDEWKAFVSIGRAFSAHDTVRHSEREYARGTIHANSAEGFNDRVRRTVSGVFHHISPRHANLYFNEIGFRWSQRIVTGQAVRRTRKGREAVRTLWSRVPPARQLSAVFSSAVGKQIRRTRDGSIFIKSSVAVFG